MISFQVKVMLIKLWATCTSSTLLILHHLPPQHHKVNAETDPWRWDKVNRIITFTLLTVIVKVCPAEFIHTNLLRSALIVPVASGPVFVVYETKPFCTPVPMTCPSCQTQSTTEVTFKVGTYAWLMCLVFVLCGWERLVQISKITLH